MKAAAQQGLSGLSTSVTHFPATSSFFFFFPSYFLGMKKFESYQKREVFQTVGPEQSVGCEISLEALGQHFFKQKNGLG